MDASIVAFTTRVEEPPWIPIQVTSAHGCEGRFFGIVKLSSLHISVSNFARDCTVNLPHINVLDHHKRSTRIIPCTIYTLLFIFQTARSLFTLSTETTRILNVDQRRVVRRARKKKEAERSLSQSPKRPLFFSFRSIWEFYRDETSSIVFDLSFASTPKGLHTNSASS